MATEDYTTYTEVDPNNHIGLVGTNHIDFDAYGNESAYRYKDKGVDHFTDFEHKVNFQPISASADYSIGCPWVLSNEVDDVHTLRIAGKTLIYVPQGKWTAATPGVALSESYAGTDYHSEQLSGLAYNTWYYLTIKKLGTALTCKVYSDSARTNLLYTLSLTLHANHSFRYIFACSTINNNTTPHYVSDIEDLDLQEAPTAGPSLGYIIG